MREGNFPMFRLAALMARQVSAPIASWIKQYARKHPGLSSATCQRVARFIYAADLRLRMWSLRLPQPATLPPLSDADALDYGANVIGEAIVFSLGALIVIFEVNRQAVNQENKVLAEKSAWLAVQMQLEELKVEVIQQQHDMDRLRAALDALANPPPPTQTPSQEEQNKSMK